MKKYKKLSILFLCIFFADLITFKIPAATPIIKKQIVNNGLVSNQLSKRNPIVDPTTTAATNSVLIFKALPKDAAFDPFLFFSIFFFAIFKRVDNSLRSLFFLGYLWGHPFNCVYKSRNSVQKCCWFPVWARICSFSVFGGTFGTLLGPFMDPLGLHQAPYGPFRAHPGPLWTLQGSSRSSDTPWGDRGFPLIFATILQTSYSGRLPPYKGEAAKPPGPY